MTAIPRWATPRSPERTSLGGDVAAIADALGRPLLDWQRALVDVAYELDDAGGFCYRTIVWGTPRRSGKSFLMLVMMLHRALGYADEAQAILYSSQSATEAGKALDTWAKLIRESPLADQVAHIRRSPGDQCIEFTNGSEIGIVAGTESAGHGRGASFVLLDECMESNHSAQREMALRPATLTVPDSMIALTSTAGSAESTYWRSWVDKGRAAVEAGVRQGICYVEYSIPDDADMGDDAVLEANSPGLGTLINLRDLRHHIDAMPDPSDARRAFGNAWTVSRSEVFTRAQIAAVMVDVDEEFTISTDPAVYALDLRWDRKSGAIATADAAGNCKVLEAGLPPADLTARMIELAEANPGSVAMDVKAPVGTEMRALEQAGIRVRHFLQSPAPPGPGIRKGHEELSITQACGSFSDRFERGELQIQRHPALDAALAAAEKRQVGDSWVWARRESTADASPLIAATMALFLATRVGSVWAYTHE
jgi:hypothetical protein